MRRWIGSAHSWSFPLDWKRPIVGLRVDAEEHGQGLVEYALVLVLATVVVVGALGMFGSFVQGEYAQINAALRAALG